MGKLSEHNEILEARIMRRVYRVWFFRRVLPWIFLEIFVLTGLYWIIHSRVTLSYVYANFTDVWATNGSVGPVANFFMSAFMHSGFLVQLASLGALVLLYILFKECTRSVKGASGMWRGARLSRRNLFGA